MVSVMDKPKVDRRVVNTKRKLKSVLLKLIQEKHVSQITVKALCAEAGVNRGTFYKYYSSPYDIIKGIENEIYDEFKATIEQNPLPSNPNVFIFYCFKLIRRHEDACRALLIAQEYKLIYRLFELIHDPCVKYWQQEFRITDQKTLNGLYTFISFGVAGVVARWVINPQHENSSEVSDFLNAVVDHGIVGFSERTR
jgi:AcrR family transcriptional regulator